MKSAKITGCTFNKTFASQHGTLYSHSITLDNGDSGEINAKEEMPSFLATGQTLWYEKIDNGKYAPKIKRMKAPDAVQPEQSNNVKDEIYEHIAQLQQRIEKMEGVIKSLVKANKLIYIEPKPEPKPQPVNANDDLPF